MNVMADEQLPVAVNPGSYVYKPVCANHPTQLSAAARATPVDEEADARCGVIVDCVRTRRLQGVVLRASLYAAGAYRRGGGQLKAETQRPTTEAWRGDPAGDATHVSYARRTRARLQHVRVSVQLTCASDGRPEEVWWREGFHAAMGRRPHRFAMRRCAVSSTQGNTQPR
jgi:hypothetical protein